MGKLIFWVVVVFVMLFAIRLWNARKSGPRPSKGGARHGAAPVAELMVRCQQCGVFLPKTDAHAIGDGYRCADGSCSRPGTSSK